MSYAARLNVSGETTQSWNKGGERNGEKFSVKSVNKGQCGPDHRGWQWYGTSHGAICWRMRGARVAILDVNGPALERVEEEIREVGGDVLAIVADCAQQSQVTAAVEQVAAHYGALDILINNAGLVLPAVLDDPAYDTSWQKSLDIMVSAQQSGPFVPLCHSFGMRNTRALSISPQPRPWGLHPTTVPMWWPSMQLWASSCHGGGIGQAGDYGELRVPGPYSPAITEGIPEEDKAGVCAAAHGFCAAMAYPKKWLISRWPWYCPVPALLPVLPFGGGWWSDHTQRLSLSLQGNPGST